MKNNSARVLSLAFAFLFCCILLTACDNSEKDIQTLNQNFNGEFQFGASIPTDDEIAENYVREEGFGCYMLTTLDGLTSFTVSGFPDCMDDYKLTRFTTTDSKYVLFGFCVGSSVESAKSALTEQGYKLDQQFSNSTYVLGKIRITITGIETVQSFSVFLESTNKQGVIF